MKKLFALAAALSLLLTLAACDSSRVQAPTQGEEGDLPKEASLYGNAAEVESCELLYGTPLFNSLDIGEFSEVEYSSLSEMLLAINSGKVDWLYLPHQTAQYMKRQHPKMTLLADGTITYYYSMLTRDSDSELCQKIDDAIDEIKADGSLEVLKKQFLCDDDSVVREAKIPSFAGADTIKIGVTGDFPPMDYIATDGKPAGFNVALCTAIGEKLGMNIRFVNVTSEARLTALSEGTVDVLFWQQSFGESAKAFDGVCVTQSYFCDFGAALTSSYSWEDIARRYGFLIKGSNGKAISERQGPIRKGTLDFTEYETESYNKYLNSEWISFRDYGSTDIEVSSFRSISDMLLALKSDRVDYIFSSYETAKYLQERNPQLTLGVNTYHVFHYCMATQGGDEVLYQKLDGAIAGMKADGSLQQLINKYIYNAKDNPVEDINLPHFEGKQTIKVGVTGDVPPMDYVSEDGMPKGFNVALMTAIAQRLSINIELVNIAATDRIKALSSGKIDTVFWLYSSQADPGEAADLLVTQPYYNAYGAFLLDDYPVEWIIEEEGLLSKKER